MFLFVAVLAAFLFSSVIPFSHAQSTPLTQPHVPLGAAWHLSLAQIEKLPSLEREKNGSLTVATTIRSGPEIVLYATWQGRTVIFRIDRTFGLHAIGIELVPEAVQHAPETDDSELRDLQYRAPMRLAVINKYGKPQGLTNLWDGLDVTPIADSDWKEANVTDWVYALSSLIWEGSTTRIAVGEQEIWYVSQSWLEQRKLAKAFLEQRAVAAQGADIVREAVRQQRLDRARNAIPARAEKFESLL